MANDLVSELTTQRDALVLAQQQAQAAVVATTARIAAIDTVLADMTRTPDTALTYGALVVDTTGVQVISLADAKANAAIVAQLAQPAQPAPAQLATPVAAPVVVPDPLDP